jgi:hypothetical protein
VIVQRHGTTIVKNHTARLVEVRRYIIPFTDLTLDFDDMRKTRSVQFLLKLSFKIAIKKGKNQSD